ncbi:MAG TPA: DUF3710 domain-containing protein [Mycobacteriales bacterium]
MFRRRNRKQDDPDVTEVAEVAGEDGPAPAVPGHGPWDVDAVPDDRMDRIDLGALRVPTPEGTELRLEADDAGEITTVLLVGGDSALQLGVFAAPRHEGIWDEVRDEIAAGIKAEGGTARDAEGDHGTELHAELSTPEGRQRVRFVGYDGPRWFVRGVFTGAAGVDEAAAGLLTDALRGVVVVRGGEPMPVRDPLPLRLPREVIESQAAEEEQRKLTLPERGPEITEIR